MLSTSPFYIFSCKDTGLQVIMYVCPSITFAENNLVKGSKYSLWFLKIPQGSLRIC